VKPRSSRLTRGLVLALKLTVLSLVAWGIHRTAYAAFEELERKHWSPAQLRLPWLALSGVLYLAGLLPSGWFWYRLLRVLGQQPRWAETLRAYFIGHLGKYVPGKALVVILRTGLIRSQRVDTGVAAVSVFYETLTQMAVGAVVACIVIAATARQHVEFMLLALALAAAAGLPTLPPVFRWLVRLLRVGKASPQAVDKLAHLNYGLLAFGWLGMAGGWVLIGLSLWAILVGSGYATPHVVLGEVVVCIAAAALAVVAGFLSLLPGGVGVREAVLLALLEPQFGSDGALVAAIVARLVWLVSEVVISGILYLKK
jgi:uncharacterized membrane protein YbhN (UPF0104 family)